jgi:RNA polymerase sigma-70 factor (ECF subfamily)
MSPGRFQLEALIAAEHANARTAAVTDWPKIARLYEQLAVITGSAVVALNHAVAVAEADGPLAGLALIDNIDGLDHYHLLWAARAEFSRRAGQMTESRSAAERALTLDMHAAERRRLERLLAAVSR